MKEFVEKLNKRIEKELPIYVGKAKGIINQFAEEYNNGWIPCEKELPHISNSYLVTKMCENDDNPIYETAHEIFWTKDNKWDCERDEYCEWKVIAWKNKIEPYKPLNN